MAKPNAVRRTGNQSTTSYARRAELLERAGVGAGVLPLPTVRQQSGEPVENCADRPQTMNQAITPNT